MLKTTWILMAAGAAAALALTAAGAADSPSTGKVPGDLWESTVQMSMPGMNMNMPARTSKFCRARNAV